MADVTYHRKMVGDREFSSTKPVAVTLNISRAANWALAFCGTNPVALKPHEQPV